MREVCFDLQGMALGSKNLPPVEQPVFITGLARSGSTMLLNALFDTGAFRSLTYQDMPFVMMSGIWRSLSGSQRVQSEKKERAHGDRLLVAYDSPEAFEEVFWRTFCADQYIFDTRVAPHKPGSGVRSHFVEFVQHVLASDIEEGRRYLAKNNNNLLRLPTLALAFPDAHILIPFREPLQHSISLLRQHQLFCDRHREDRFGMQYMMWLGHWEFGLAHKNYAYSGEDNPFEPGDINYWLHCWLDAYTYALNTAPGNSIFFSYENLCARPLPLLTELAVRLGVECDMTTAAGNYVAAKKRDCEGVDRNLLDNCSAIYERLQLRSKA